MPPRSAARSKTSKPTTKSPQATSARGSVPASLELRSNSALYFVKSGWSKQKRLVEPFVDAIARTALFEYLPLLSVGGAAAKPRGTMSAIKSAFMSGKSRCGLLAGGTTAYSEETTAFIELQLGSGAVQILTFVRGDILATLGSRALDDFFTLLRSLHDDLDGAAYVETAYAWTDWDDNKPKPKLRSAWPLRAIADVVEPARPKEDDDDVVSDAAKAIAKAKPPAGVVRTTHGGLVMLRWIDDPTDAGAANAAAVKHESWVKGLVQTEAT